MRLAERIQRSGLEIESRHVGQGEWPMSAPGRPIVHDKWRVVLRLDGRSITIPFHKGEGHGGAPPEADEVMEAVLSDVASFLNANGFEDWARDFGYDTDSRYAETVYKACEAMNGRLAYLLLNQKEAWLWQTEL